MDNQDDDSMGGSAWIVCCALLTVAALTVWVTLGGGA